MKETKGLMIAGLALAFGWMGRGQDSATNAVSVREADTNGAVRVIQPVQLDLPPALAEVVKLAESGVGESVVLAYIQKSPGCRIGSDQIVYLQDLGISQEVIKALIEHEPSASESVVPSPPEPTPVATNTPNVAPASASDITADTNASVAVVNFFSESLAPYGSWVNVPPYGLCWQPTIVLVNRAWRPYCDNGYWLWSDQGWYWRSSYSWGWAPFHYGRWFHHPYRGWFWWPDRAWGPSWVCWRSSPGCYGWAPLPPRSSFTANLGWTFNGVSVGFNFGFGLGPSHYTFVQPAHFVNRQLATYALPSPQVATVFNNTTVINNYVAGSNNRVINQGIDRRQVETAIHSRIAEVKVRELPQGHRFAVADRVTRVGRSAVIYRPGSQMTVPPAPRARRTTTPDRTGTTRGTVPVRPIVPANPPEVRPGSPQQPNALEVKPAEGLMRDENRPSSVPTGPSRQPTPPIPSSRPAPSHRKTPPAPRPSHSEGPGRQGLPAPERSLP